ncbi:MAG: glucosylceramidase [Spirochaetes bacterium]|jgi:glucosylceramidase|nr:glucosylceramidase [Spirochaetota bacterium]
MNINSKAKRRKGGYHLLMLSVLILTAFFTVSCTSGKGGTVNQFSTDKDGKELKNSFKYHIKKHGSPDLVIETGIPAQYIDGFGGAFNEAGWEALQILDQAGRDTVIKQLFDETQGAAFDLCRVPIGSSDYALKRYSHNETPNDYQMNNFSIERDHKYLLPYIKAALKFQPDLAVWGSAWTPPTWMKDNKSFNSGKIIDNPKIYEAYALYLAKFIEAYREEGINLIEVAVQNEPEVLRPYPTCGWDGNQFHTFIKNHLGPLFKRKEIKAGIMLGTFSDAKALQNYIRPILNDPDCNSYISSVGFQWNGIDILYDTKQEFSDKRYVQTETECGNWSWPGKWNEEIPDFVYDRQKPQNDYSYAVYTFNRILEYFREGANSYLLWNMVLDEKGLNNNEETPWPQNAAVVVDTLSKKAILTPMYYAFRQFSRYIKKGAHYLPSQSKDNFAAAFLNPDGSIIVVMKNTENKIKEVTVQFGEHSFSAELPARSFTTAIIEPSLDI